MKKLDLSIGTFSVFCLGFLVGLIVLCATIEYKFSAPVAVLSSMFATAVFSLLNDILVNLSNWLDNRGDNN